MWQTEPGFLTKKTKSLGRGEMAGSTDLHQDTPLALDSKRNRTMAHLGTAARWTLKQTPELTSSPKSSSHCPTGQGHQGNADVLQAILKQANITTLDNRIV
jgi:hypothetical protein